MPTDSDQPTSDHFSAVGALLAKPTASPAASPLRTLTPKRPADSSARSVREPRSTHASISGGSSESEVTAFAERPEGPSAVSAVITVTPVGNRDIAERSCSEGTGVSRMSVGFGSFMGAPGIAEKYDAALVRTVLIPIAAAVCALLIAACGSEGVSVSESESTASAGADLFTANCAGCHTLSAAGSQGSGNRALRAQGPNLDQRVESYDDTLFAIRNGGYSGAIMPQNIVVGEDASLVAEFVSKYSGSEVEEPARPSTTSPGVETGEANAVADDVVQDDEAAAPTQGSQSQGGDAGSGSGSGGNSGQN